MPIECPKPGVARGTQCPPDCQIRKLAEAQQRTRARDDKTVGGIWGETDNGQTTPPTENGLGAQRRDRLRSLPGSSEREVQQGVRRIYEVRDGKGCENN